MVWYWGSQLRRSVKPMTGHPLHTYQQAQIRGRKNYWWGYDLGVYLNLEMHIIMVFQHVTCLIWFLYNHIHSSTQGAGNGGKDSLAVTGLYLLDLGEATLATSRRTYWVRRSTTFPGDFPVFIRAGRLDDQLFTGKLVYARQVFVYKGPHQCALDVIGKCPCQTVS